MRNTQIFYVLSCSSWLLACGAGNDAASSADSDGLENAGVGPNSTEAERPPGSLNEGVGRPMSLQVAYEIFAFSNTPDTEPTTISVESAVSSRSCQVRLPGNEPMTLASNGEEITCDTDPLGPDGLLLWVRYPQDPLLPRTEESRMEPGPRPPPRETVCTGDACTVSSDSNATARNPAPDFPHVQVEIYSEVTGDAVIGFQGNGRDLEIPISLSGGFDVYDAPYVNVDESDE